MLPAATAIARARARNSRQSLDAVAAPVHEVSHENVALVGDLAADVKQLQQIVELAVDVTAHGHGRRHRLHGRLLHKQRLHHIAQLLEVRLGQMLASLDFFNPRIQIILLGHIGRCVGGGGGLGAESGCEKAAVGCAAAREVAAWLAVQMLSNF